MMSSEVASDARNYMAKESLDESSFGPNKSDFRPERINVYTFEGVDDFPNDTYDSIYFESQR